MVSVKSRGFEKVEEEKDDYEIITEVDEKGIKGTKPKEEEKPLIIPLIKSKLKLSYGSFSTISRFLERIPMKYIELI